MFQEVSQNYTSLIAFYHCIIKQAFQFLNETQRNYCSKECMMSTQNAYSKIQEVSPKVNHMQEHQDLSFDTVTLCRIISELRLTYLSKSQSLNRFMDIKV